MRLRHPAPAVAAAAALASSAALVPAAHAKSWPPPAARHAAHLRHTTASPQQATASSSFDWGDGAVGAGAALAVLVAAGSAARLTVRRRPATGLTD